MQPGSSASRPSAPPSLVFDHNLDSGLVLWQRLHDRAQGRQGLRLILHLKNGDTHVGSLVYFDPRVLTLSSRGRHYEFWVRDLAHVLAVPLDDAVARAGWE